MKSDGARGGGGGTVEFWDGGGEGLLMGSWGEEY